MIIPPFLQAGDRVGVVATAKKVNVENTNRGIEILESWGLRVEKGPNLFATYGALAGTDAQRAADLQAMINDDGIKAIFMVRGGYGSTRIIDHIDFAPLESFPKWICGFSDITAFHIHLFNLGIACLHGPMPSFFYAITQDSLHWYRDYIFGARNTLKTHGHPQNKTGTARAKLVGGNLSIICHTMGSPSQIQTNGNILFIEDIGEQLYHLDRMMVQLKRAGLLQDLAGLIVGQFTDMKDDDPFGKDVTGIILDHVDKYDYPICFDFPVGHSAQNYALPIGLMADLHVTEHEVILNLEYNKSGD
ncbi:MAG: LD-carboxypeptidase [Cyclobacteriaceae bacterium]|nr:LD-carboxypeptidase [Cyclobacteriaceae bacterium]